MQRKKENMFWGEKTKVFREGVRMEGFADGDGGIDVKKGLSGTTRGMLRDYEQRKTCD